MHEPLLGAAFAITSAAIFGWFSPIARMGQKHANATTGVLMGLLVSLPILLAMTVLAWQPSWWNGRAFFFLVLAGTTGPACSRVLIYLSIHRLGVARTMPLMATIPLFTALFAHAFLGERPGPYIWVGTVLIVAGSAALSYKRESDTSWERRHLWLPFLSLITGALSFVCRKAALGYVAAPLLGATVSSLTGLLLLLPLARFMPEGQRPKFDKRKAWLFYGLCGIMNTASFLFIFCALNYADASVAIPLSSTAPLFALLASRVFLTETERITRLIVGGTVCIVLGAALIGWRLA